MQLISNIPKYLLLVLLLGCSILITCTNVTMEASNLGFFGPDLTLTTKPDSIWDSIRQEFTLDHQTQSAQVQAEIRKLVADPERFYSILNAAAPYMYFIYEKIHAHSLPMELALIPFIESEFNPNDHSNKGATGLWQLMPQTAKDLGVTVKGGYDGRRNVVASTNAALAFFNDLGNNFNGNWYLAIAAYNCGPGCVQHAARRAGTEDFWKLPVPKETKYYVPRLLAVAAIIENPEKYGMQLPTIGNEPYFQEVKADKQISLQKVAESTGVNIKTLTKLNPDSKSGIIPLAKNNNATVLVPVKTPVQAPITTIVASSTVTSTTTTTKQITTKITHHITVTKKRRSSSPHHIIHHRVVHRIRHHG